MSKRIIKAQGEVLKVISGSLGEFYLAGGTALSLYYFHHRESVDLDFFSRDFNIGEVKRIVEKIEIGLGSELKLVNQRLGKNKSKIAIYNLALSGNELLKIDFVQDYCVSVKPLRLIDGIAVLSLEDIYMRKIHAIGGVLPVEDVIGAKFFKGGRQEAKDFYDLYCLSGTFMRLSIFIEKFGGPLMREAMIRWFRSYERLAIKEGLLELKTKNRPDFTEMERHFKKEIDLIVEKEVDSV